MLVLSYVRISEKSLLRFLAVFDVLWLITLAFLLSFSDDVLHVLQSRLRG